MVQRLGSGDEVVARRNDRTLRAAGRSEFVKNGSTGWVVAVDVDRCEVVVDFVNEGPITIPRGYVEAGHMEHGYARTTYGVQGATVDRARYHPTDVSRFEEGYVAVTRATERTQLYIVEGDLDIDDETGHHVIERSETSLPTLAEALARRRDQRLATETDPHAVEAARLAQTHTLADLRERSRGLDRLLAKQPPAVTRELAQERRTLSALRERRAQLDSERPSWKPSRRRAANQTLSSLDRAISHADQQVATLDAQQARHEAFADAHADDIAERELLRQAAAASRLKVRLEAVVDPPLALSRLLGPRPTSQRERLRWDRAIESIVVHLDERARPVPDRAATLAAILGPRPAELLARVDHDRVTNAARSALERDRDLGRSLGRA